MLRLAPARTGSQWRRWASLRAKIRIVRIYIWLAMVLLCTTAQGQEMTVTGKLVHLMAVGGESTGWAIERESGRIEVDFRDRVQFEGLANKTVRATGTLSRRHGVETGDRSVLGISSIKEVEAKFSLKGSEWLLEDLAGSGVIDRVQATLAFSQAGKVEGNGSCNRFFGDVEINGDAIRFGPVGSTRMACSEAVMNQETKYLKALQAAERFERKEQYLLIYSKNAPKPLLFTRKRRPDLNRLFGKVWQVTNAPSKPALGSIFIFLANGTVLETACTETYRVATWTIDKNEPSVLRVVEDRQLAFTAEIVELSDGTLQLRQNLVRSNEKRDIMLKALEQEFVCPDLRK